jgi:hypothetical protein
MGTTLSFTRVIVIPLAAHSRRDGRIARGLAVAVRAEEAKLLSQGDLGPSLIRFNSSRVATPSTTSSLHPAMENEFIELREARWTTGGYPNGLPGPSVPRTPRPFNRHQKGTLFVGERCLVFGFAIHGVRLALPAAQPPMLHRHRHFQFWSVFSPANSYI